MSGINTSWPLWQRTLFFFASIVLTAVFLVIGVLLPDLMALWGVALIAMLFVIAYFADPFLALGTYAAIMILTSYYHLDPIYDLFAFELYRAGFFSIIIGLAVPSALSFWIMQKHKSLRDMWFMFFVMLVVILAILLRVLSNG